MPGEFIIVCVLSALLIALTSLITYEILGFVWNKLPRLRLPPQMHILIMLGPIFIAHIVNIWVYAVIYFVAENYTNLGFLMGHIGAPALTYESFIERLYFSASTYASLGLGDIAPQQHLRMLAAAEVLNGLVMIGWTVSFTYLAMEKSWLRGRKNAD